MTNSELDHIDYTLDNSSEHMLISDMDVLQRPREKAMRYGISSLSDADLMAIIFATGVKGKSVLTLCREILDANGNHLSRVTKKTHSQLCQEHKGIGPVKAITLLAALELGRRSELDSARIAASTGITNSKDAYDFMKHHFRNLQHEEFWVMYLNRGGHVVNESRISMGGTAATTVDVKIIIRNGLQILADSMILFHNHPSGTLRPSDADDKLTERVKAAAKLMDMRVNDHIIIGYDSYYSYSDRGRI